MNTQVKSFKVAVVTGSTGAIGKAIARNLAGEKDLRVIMVARDEHKAGRAAEEVRQATGNERVEYALADLSRKSEVYRFAAGFGGPVHILVNNAGVTPRTRMETPEGIEMQFATNVLGYFWMIDAFTPHLKLDPPSRVVNVASYWAGGMRLDDLEFHERRYNNDSAYRQSKQADRMLSVAFAEKLRPHGITVNSCHPGDVNSNLSNNLGFGGHETPDDGADTPVWLATADEVAGITGRYFERRAAALCSYTQDKQAVEKLFSICSSF